MTAKLLHLCRQSQTIRTPQPKIFFRVQSTRLADPFEPLNSFLAQLGEGPRALVRQPKTAVFKAEIEVRIYCRSALKVLIKTKKAKSLSLPLFVVFSNT